MELLDQVVFLAVWVFVAINDVTFVSSFLLVNVINDFVVRSD